MQYRGHPRPAPKLIRTFACLLCLGAVSVQDLALKRFIVVLRRLVECLEAGNLFAVEDKWRVRKFAQYATDFGLRLVCDVDDLGRFKVPSTKRYRHRLLPDAERVTGRKTTGRDCLSGILAKRITQRTISGL